VYFGGTFTNWDGGANEDRIASYDGTNFAALSTGIANGQVNILEIGVDGTTLYIGGTFTSPQTRMMYWNGSAFVAMGSGATGTVYAILAARNGNVYIGGDISPQYVTYWDGNTWNSMGGGVNNIVYMIEESSTGLIIVSGLFTLSSGTSTSSTRDAQHYAYWNGYTWTNVDVTLPGNPTSRGAAWVGADLYIGYDTAGTATSSGITTVTNSGSTLAYPIITITGTTTAGGTSTLEWLENRSTEQVIYFSLDVQCGETVVIDLSPGKKSITSNWRGRIYDNPLANSDFANFHLLPGSNSIVCYLTGTTTGAAVIMSWNPLYLSVDGIV
jgi:hypothetical protein